MEAEWEPVLMEIMAYKETGTFIMKSGEETAQMLDDHIVMTQAMSFSPYKKPFEGRITAWENKLRTTQVYCIGLVYLFIHTCVHANETQKVMQFKINVLCHNCKH